MQRRESIVRFNTIVKVYTIPIVKPPKREQDKNRVAPPFLACIGEPRYEQLDILRNRPRRLIKCLPSSYFKSLRNNIFRFLVNAKKNGLTISFDERPEKIAMFLGVVEKIARNHKTISRMSRTANLSWSKLDKDRRHQIMVAANTIVHSGEFVKDFADIVKRAALDKRLPKCYRDLFRTISDEWLPQKAFEWFDSIADNVVCDLAAYDRFIGYIISYLRIIITCPLLNKRLKVLDSNRILHAIFTTVANEPIGNNVMDRSKWKPRAPSTIAWSAQSFIYHKCFRCRSGRFFREIMDHQHDDMTAQEVADIFKSMIH